MDYKRGMTIIFKDREELITQGSSDSTNGVVLTNKRTYSVDFLNRWLEFGFITVKYNFMNATKAKELLKSVPEEQFLRGFYTNGTNKCCSLGHLVRLTSIDPSDYSEMNCDVYSSTEVDEFDDKVIGFIKQTYNEIGSIVSVNDTTNINGYNEDTPKKRVLHLLDDMIKAGH